MLHGLYSSVLPNATEAHFSHRNRALLTDFKFGNTGFEFSVLIPVKMNLNLVSPNRKSVSQT